MTSYCPACGKLVYFAEKIFALGADWHKSCFKCTNKECKKILTLGKQVDKNQKPYCAHCYNVYFGRTQYKQQFVKIQDFAGEDTEED
ncbi:hypothetical protein L5515_016398 [Caenorhabditis briggsae]|uniref:Cysteine-rich protein 1 n=1 Tax=Caenorhabditis briggsae TaxID=6238 RepID=A0AAE9JQ30_CAEBR|nr:hypothetical protein L5515_016398 [Caenorhabditis briggsae]